MSTSVLEEGGLGAGGQSCGLQYVKYKHVHTYHSRYAESLPFLEAGDEANDNNLGLLSEDPVLGYHGFQDYRASTADLFMRSLTAHAMRPVSHAKLLSNTGLNNSAHTYY